MVVASIEHALKNADELISILLSKGHCDYSSYREEIASEFYVDPMWDNQFCSDEFDEESTLDHLRFIPTDYYENQHYVDTDKPKWNKRIEVPKGYLWLQKQR